MEWITCENTHEESWRRLLEYANVDLAIEAIESIHGKSTPQIKANYKKQAEQARVSLLQAKEYFEAARSSSLFTQPNHLYYGAVALSTACMLIRGDGSKSLDFLRNNSKNSHHGLDFTFSSDQKAAKQGIKLLENSYVKICPNGHFSNWYSTLIEQQDVGALHTRVMNGHSTSNLEVVGKYNIPKFNELINAKYSLDCIIKRLPDLQSELGRYGLHSNSVRGEHKIIIDLKNQQNENIFVFHSSPSYEVLMSVIEEFKCDEGVCFSVEVEHGAKSGIVRSRKDKDWSFSFPDSRESLDHRVFFFKESVITPEVVDLLLISYALSMLSRYFPDIWVSFLESHCKGSKLVEQIVHLLTMKLPTLMLNQISGRNYIISTHRPFWH
ncbi:MAG: hypothetical protein FIA91_06805 [Geobacter sp.]|nr:hypothetical protein [Geobacter sp.]